MPLVLFLCILYSAIILLAFQQQSTQTHPHIQSLLLFTMGSVVSKAFFHGKTSCDTSRRNALLELGPIGSRDKENQLVCTGFVVKSFADDDVVVVVLTPSFEMKGRLIENHCDLKLHFGGFSMAQSVVST